MNLLKPIVLAILFTLSISGYSLSQEQKNQKMNRLAKDKLNKWENPMTEFRNIGKTKIDSVSVEKEKISIYFSPILSYYPFRENTLDLFSESIRKALGKKFRKYNQEVFTNGFRIDELIPNIYRKQLSIDQTRILPAIQNIRKLVTNVESSYYPGGMSANSIALWHSHGYYFDLTDNRWKWQRARLFGTVEDISVMGYTLPYLVPMLENAGANVFLPRERDIQSKEVIVDNDRSTGNSRFITETLEPVFKLNEGFLLTDTLFDFDNPFKRGTSLSLNQGTARYIPEIPEKGEYAVYISYPKATETSGEVIYSVVHTGGTTKFMVNQTMGGGTWIYLGTFLFNAGMNPGKGEVRVTGKENGPALIDALRFGGGTGIVARRQSIDAIQNKKSVSENASDEVIKNHNDTLVSTWKLSNKPKYIEGSRYFLQYAGMPDSVYSPNKYKNDYNDDYQSRGYWVNYLTAGSPRQPGMNGLGIPLDLSLAFHTDAGITPNDSVIGTLGIYCTGAMAGKFPDGKSRMASRDLTDLIQTQVVEDIRNTFSGKWVRRGLWDRPYSEARKPNVPAMLIELLSHQNQADQSLGFDPEYKFGICRAIYKGMLKYLCYQEHRNYVVQPLPVNNFAINPAEGKTVRLSWSPVDDPLEPTARPSAYKIYKRTGDNGFDNGLIVSNTFYETTLESWDTIFSFKITALNEGGESFPSEILAVGLKENDSKPMLVVNGFDRVSGPQWFDKAGMAGVAWWDDQGVPYKKAISEVGNQFNFDRASKWENDDAPGWGASYANEEGKVIIGNTFDYPYIHGKAILAAGCSFFSVSDEYFLSDKSDATAFKSVDLILGEEKTSPSLRDTSGRRYQIYSPQFIRKIEELTGKGVNFFISGAYVGTDLVLNKDSMALKFAAKTLHFKPLTGHAVKSGSVFASDFGKPWFSGEFTFNSGLSDRIYTVEGPDAIVPAGKEAISALRYKETNTGAGIAFKGKNRTVVMGFPFETILSEGERNQLMKQVISFLGEK